MSMEGRLVGPNRNEQQQAAECAVRTSVHRWIGAVAGAGAAVADDDDADGSWNVQLYCRSRRAFTFVFTFNTRGEKKKYGETEIYDLIDFALCCFETKGESN